MTPSARLSAAITVLDDILSGAAAETALTAWGRASRFAGSGDRHAVRDLVFDALRCKRSFAALGGAMTGRGLILGGQRAAGKADLFTGQGHAPSVITDADQPRDATRNESLDCPDWLEPQLQDSLGNDFAAVLRALQRRAPVYIRINTLMADVHATLQDLSRDGIQAQFTQIAKNALQVTEGARKIQNSNAYLSGMIELQDASSQAVVESLKIPLNAKVLDYCAGGGGKTLALATAGPVFAHDANPRRMADLPARAARAGARVTLLDDPAAHAPYDLILIDAPCSGSGSWRRDPQGKWALTAPRLAELVKVQAQILDHAASLLAPNGVLAYATCSLLGCENQSQIQSFLHRTPGFAAVQTHWSPLSGGDGFFLAQMSRNVANLQKFSQN